LISLISLISVFFFVWSRRPDWSYFQRSIHSHPHPHFQGLDLGQIQESDYMGHLVVFVGYILQQPLVTVVYHLGGLALEHGGVVAQQEQRRPQQE